MKNASKLLLLVLVLTLSFSISLFGLSGCAPSKEPAAGETTAAAGETTAAAEVAETAEEKEVKELFTEVVDPNLYLEGLGERWVDVEFSPFMNAEPINTPMTPHWEVKEPPWTFGYSDLTISNPWRTTVMKEAQYEAEKHPEIGEFFVTEAGGDINDQISDIENLIAKNIDALIIVPGSPSALVPVIEKAYDSGIVIIVVHGRVDTEKFTCSIQPDEYGFGWIFGDWLGKKLNGQGEVVGIKAMAGYKPAIDRWAGALDGISQYPDIKIIGEEFGQWDPVEGKKAATSLLAAHKDFDGILSIDPWATAAILELMAYEGREMVPTTGFEENSSFKAWIDNDVEGIGCYEPTWLSAEAVIAAIKVLQGQPVYKRYLTNAPIITEEVRDKIYRPDMSSSYYPGSRLPEEMLQEIFK